MLAVRVVAAFGVVCLLVLMLGPFQGAEGGVGMTDGAAHLAAFGLITGALMINLPRSPRLHVAGLALSLGIAVELVQGATGRSASLHDVAADALGIAIVTLGWWRRRLLYGRRPRRSGICQTSTCIRRPHGDVVNVRAVA